MESQPPCPPLSDLLSSHAACNLRLLSVEPGPGVWLLGPPRHRPRVCLRSERTAPGKQQTACPACSGPALWLSARVGTRTAVPNPLPGCTVIVPSEPPFESPSAPGSPQAPGTSTCPAHAVRRPARSCGPGVGSRLGSQHSKETSSNQEEATNSVSGPGGTASNPESGTSTWPRLHLFARSAESARTAGAAAAAAMIPANGLFGK
ncbi:hypothetical protein ACRRTK_013012 [Alexandromys fortis]